MSLTRRRLLAAGTATSLAMGMTGTSFAKADEPDLTGLKILITGCSSGFGRDGAIYYARRGATVIASMRNLPRPEGEELMRLAEAQSLDLHVVQIDVLDERSVADGYAQAKAILGDAPDVLLNNAGIAIVGPIEAQDIEATKLAYDTNVFGYQRLIRAVLPEMRARGAGHIINMSSQSGRLIWPGLGHYCPTKFAVEAMSDTLAYETAAMGIEVTAVQPGGYPTKFWENREELTLALKERSASEHLDGYGAMAQNMGSGRIPNLPGDPQTVVKAVALAMTAPAGEKPFRVMVSHWDDPQAPINAASDEVHIRFLGRGPFSDAVKAVHSG